MSSTNGSTAESIAAGAAAGGSRLLAARRRSRRAQAALVAGSLVAFLLAGVLARGTAAGHSKHAAAPLTAPPRFVEALRRDSLRAGMLAPAAAPPATATATS